MDFTVDIQDHFPSILQEAIDSEDFTDVTLITEDAVEIKANRLVLSIIPMFRDILKASDEQDEQVIILELDSIIVHLLLELLYTGSLVGGENELIEVNEAIKEFGISHLRLESPYYGENVEDEPEPEHKSETDNPKDQPVEIDNRKDQPVDNDNPKLELEKEEKVPEVEKQVLGNEKDPTEPTQTKKRREKRNLNAVFPSLECPECNKTFKTKSSLATHHKNKHENLKYDCAECKQEFTLYSSFQTHKKTIHGKERQKCTQCEYTTARPDNLKKHISTKHYEGAKEGKRRPRLACHVCHKTLADKTSLNGHIRTAHAEVLHRVDLDLTIISCKDCDFKGSSEKSLQNHRKFAHDGVQFPCSDCRYVAKTQHLLNKHFRDKHEGFQQTEQ